MLTEEYVALGGLITIIAAALALIIKQLEASAGGRDDDAEATNRLYPTMHVAGLPDLTAQHRSRPSNTAGHDNTAAPDHTRPLLMRQNRDEVRSVGQSVHARRTRCTRVVK